MCRREHLFFPIWEFAISRCGLWKGLSFSTSNRMRESFMGRAIGQTQLLPARERLFPRETLAVYLLKGSVGGFFLSKLLESSSQYFLDIPSVSGYPVLTSSSWPLVFTVRCCFFPHWSGYGLKWFQNHQLWLHWSLRCFSALWVRFLSLCFLISSWLLLPSRNSFAFTCFFKHRGL